MGKKRNAKRGADHKANSKRRTQEKVAEVNRFELKFNRSKHAVIGKSGSKHVAGAPSVSRKKSEENRKKTLLVEYERKVKSNTVVDKRLAERDAKLGQDEKIAKRSALQHKKSLDGKVKGGLGGSILTHGGVSVADIERHDRPVTDDLGDNELQTLTAQFVTGAHFGGGELGTKDDMTHKSRKDLISELISKTRSLRAAKQMEREEMQNMTDKLDEQWKEFTQAGLMQNMVEGKEEKQVGSGADDYDRLVRELQFEKKRSVAGEKSKSEEDIAKIEKDRLQKLEQERVNRMQALNSVPVGEGDDSDQEDAMHVSAPKPVKHISADDDDTCNLQFAIQKDEKFVVEYANGQLVNREKLSRKRKRDVGGDIDEASDGGSDDQEVESSLQAAKPKNKKKCAEQSKEVSELPFVFEMPEDYKQFVELMEHERKDVVLARLIKCFHPKLSKNNRPKLKRLFLYALRFFDSTATSAFDGTLDAKKELAVLCSITPALYELTQFNANNAAKCCRALLTKYRQQFIKKRRLYPSFSCIALVRLLPKLFPASDYWHSVMSPALLFLCNILRRARNKDTKDVAKGLLLSAVIVEYVAEAKKYVPELVAFLKGVLFASVSHEANSSEINDAGTFPISHPHNQFMLINGEKPGDTPMKVSLETVFGTGNGQEELKVACLRTCIALWEKLLKIYKDLPSYPEITASVLRLVSRIPVQLLPESVRNLVENFVKTTRESVAKVKRWPLVRQVQSKKMVTFLEPKVDSNFDPDRPKSFRGTQVESQLLKRRIRKETRNTMRELRRDSQFLGRVKLRETLQKDADRKRKTKELLSTLSSQEAEYKKFKRMSEKKK